MEIDKGEILSVGGLVSKIRQAEAERPNEPDYAIWLEFTADKLRTHHLGALADMWGNPEDAHKFIKEMKGAALCIHDLRAENARLRAEAADIQAVYGMTPDDHKRDELLRVATALYAGHMAHPAGGDWPFGNLITHAQDLIAAVDAACREGRGEAIDGMTPSPPPFGLTDDTLIGAYRVEDHEIVKNGPACKAGEGE